MKWGAWRDGRLSTAFYRSGSIFESWVSDDFLFADAWLDEAQNDGDGELLEEASLDKVQRAVRGM